MKGFEKLFSVNLGIINRKIAEGVPQSKIAAMMGVSQPMVAKILRQASGKVEIDKQPKGDATLTASRGLGLSEGQILSILGEKELGTLKDIDDRNKGFLKRLCKIIENNPDIIRGVLEGEIK